MKSQLNDLFVAARSRFRRCRRIVPAVALGLILNPTSHSAEEPPAKAATTSDPGATIRLPPFIVEDSPQRPTWRYVELPGVEVLSLCSRPITEHFAANYYRITQMLRQVLPDELRWRPAIPTAVILVNEDDPAVISTVTLRLQQAENLRRMKQTIAPEIDREVQKLRHWYEPGWTPPGSEAKPPQFGFIPNLRIVDADSEMLFTVVRESEFDPRALTFAVDNIRSQLEQRAPPLPRWFVDGVVKLYESAAMTSTGIQVPPFVWLSESDTERLRVQRPGVQIPLNLLPIEKLFASEPSARAATDEVRRLRECQLALFVRWALADPARRTALWKLASAGTHRVITEEVFDACFGPHAFRLFDWNLHTYLLNAAIFHHQKLASAKDADEPMFHSRTASDLETARIVGDWERRAAHYAATTHPEYARHYVEQAQRTLTRAYDQGARDPRLLSVLALTRCEAGDDAEALPLLEAAAAAHVARPRIYCELARILLAREKTFAALNGGWLTDEERAAVLAPLAEARRFSPPMIDGYESMLGAWELSAIAPPTADVAVLEEGIRTFPRLGLIYRVGALFAKHGLMVEAARCADFGLQLTADPQVRQRFEGLRVRDSIP